MNEFALWLCLVFAGSLLAGYILGVSDVYRHIRTSAMCELMEFRRHLIRRAERIRAI